MLYAEARRPARRASDGRFVPMDEQNTGLWDVAMIDEAEEILHRVLADHRDNEDFVEMYRPYWTEARQHQGKDVIPDW